MKTTSKFSFTQVYLMYGFMIVILILAVYLITRPNVMLRTAFGSTMSAAYTGLMFMVLSLLYFYYNHKYVLKIYITENMLIIRSFFWQHAYTIHNIQNIDLFARKNLNWLTSQIKSNGISIHTYNKSYFLADIYYRNAPEVKSAIYKEFKPVVCNQIKYENADDEQFHQTYVDMGFEKFSGNYVFSTDIISIVIGYVIVILIFPKDGLTFTIIVNLFFLLLIIISFLVKGNYFLLSRKQLIVKNLLFWKKNIVFDLSNIRSVIIEKYVHASNSIRINTKNFHSRSFQASALTNKTWQKFTNKLKEIDVEVKNEL